MRVLVFGAGAVGTFAGAMLARAGHDVTLVCRPEAAQAINAQGVTVTSPQSGGTRFQAWPRASADLGAAWSPATPFELVILAVKSYDVPEALAELLAVTEQPPPLLTVQNGIGIEELVQARFAMTEVIAGSVTIPLSRPSPELVAVEKSGRGMTLAPTAAGQSLARWVALWQQAGIETTLAPDQRQLKWSKALLNMVGNASAAILNMPPGAVYRDQHGYRLELAMLRETLAVMACLSISVIDLPGSPARRLAQALRWLPGWALQPLLVRLVSRGRGAKLPSFLLDLNAGKPRNEVTFHNGAVARAGAAQAIPTPVNRALDAILMDLVTGRLARERFAGRPAALAAAVAETASAAP